MKEIKFDQLLDAKALNCPLPLLKTKQALRYLEAGQVLKVEATDAGSLRDFTVFIAHSTHTMLDSQSCDGIYSYLIQKG